MSRVLGAAQPVRPPGELTVPLDAINSADWRPAVVETHSSIVFFVGDTVYKLKKPVDLGFLDWSSRPARQLACHREVELNRRLTEDVYLGVADITGPDGKPLDHLVVMRRMPDQRRLSTMASRGRDLRGGLREIARVLASFHSRTETSEAISEAGSPETILAHWVDNLALVRRLGSGLLGERAINEVELLARRYLGGRHPLLRRRVDAGQVRDVHGDLQADDIFLLDDGPRILDCLDFDDRLRHGDVLSDTAFLAMDLERLGRPDLADEFLSAYREFSGENHPASLAHHYIAYRAHVRAKVTLIRRAQGDPGAAAAARLLHDLCLRHLRLGAVNLVLIGGPPGTGKSTLATALAERTGWAVLRSDQVRREMVLPADERYTEIGKDTVYAELLSRAERLLVVGETVILDATWSRDRWRRQAADAAARTTSELGEFCCELSEELAQQRVAARARIGNDVSDAGPAEAALIAADFEDWPAAQILNNRGPLDDAVARVIRRLQLRSDAPEAQDLRPSR